VARKIVVGEAIVSNKKNTMERNLDFNYDELKPNAGVIHG